MRRNIGGLLATIALVGTVAFNGPAAHAAESVTGGGSSFAGGILTACAATFPASSGSVTYTPSSSGTGRSNFAAGTTDFGGSDAAYAATDKKPAKFAYVPVIGGPVTIPFNVAGVSKLKLNAKVIGSIFQGKIKKWNDPAIKKLNTTAKLPNRAINVVYRSSKSGTTENFAAYLKANGANSWTADGNWATATGLTTPVGVGAPTSSELVNKVLNTGFSIGYADLSDSNKKGLPFASVLNGAGQYVVPSAKTAAAFLAKQKVLNSGLVDINFTSKIKGAYNLSILTYALVPTASSNPAKAAVVKKFVNHVLTKCAPTKAAALGYVALTGTIKTKALNIAGRIK